MPFSAVSSMVRVLLAAVVIAALVYTSFGPGANAQTLDPVKRAQLLEMREGDMRKLNLHAKARPAPKNAFLDGEDAEHRLSETNGKVRLVNFWATWCAPCRTEKPSLDRLAAALSGPDFEIITIAAGPHDLAAIKRFNQEVGIKNLETFYDPKSEVSRSAGVPGLPVTILVNREGQEIGRLMGGAEWDTEAAQKLIREVIALSE